MRLSPFGAGSHTRTLSPALLSAASLLRRLRPPRDAGVVPRLAAAVAVLSVLLVAVSIASLSTGAVDISASQVVAILLEPLGVHLTDYSRTSELVVEQIRLPRIVVGALVGAALGVSGATLQGLFRNPMADPGIIGVSAGGAAGAVISIALGINTLFFLALPLFAFGGAIGAAFLVYAIAAVGGRFSMSSLLLAGIAVAAFLNAVSSAVLIAAPTQDAAREILFWLAGGLNSRGWDHVWLSAPLIIGGTAVIVALSRDLNVMMVGDDDALAVGVNVRVLRPVLIGVAALVTGVSVAVSGTITFIGLVVPHMLRLVFGPDHRVLIPASALGGAVMLVLADMLARTLLQPAEIRVGIVTSFVGAPFFIFLLIRNKQRASAF